jgi:hypothetical protein
VRTSNIICVHVACEEIVEKLRNAHIVYHMTIGPKQMNWTGHVARTREKRSDLTLILLMWRIGWANSIPIYVYIHQDAKLHSSFISGNCSTCFGWYFHPSSEEHAYATHSTPKPVPTLPWIAADSSNGLTNTRCCRYSCMRSWWWVEVPPETCRAVSRYK